MCWGTHAALTLLLVVVMVPQSNTECTYLGVVFLAGSTVPVTEPCLRCVCARSGLLCQLRVCAELPDPPPPGCVLVHRRKSCCPQLRCHDEPVHSNRIEARFEPDFPEVPYNQTTVGSGCVEGGTRYGPGSAMHTSTRCSYCYCIGGRERCVRPRCLLPAPGCTPQFRPHACCPTSYKCRATANITTATLDPESCLVGGVVVAAGARATGAARSPCDACYCVRGAVRCTPLRCAPALPGCAPLVPRDACCPTSYNCSGTIEVQPLLNYESAPDVSPEYAQLRTRAPPSAPTPSGPHYVMPEPQQRRATSTPYYFTSTPTSRQHVATTKHLPLESTNPESSSKYARISFATTRVANNDKEKKITTEAASVILSPVYKPNFDNSSSKTLKYSNYIDTDFNNDDIYIDGRNNRRIDDQLETTTETSTIQTIETTESDITTTDGTTEVSTTTDTTTEVTVVDSTTFETTTITIPLVKLIGNNSECIDGTEELTTITTVVETTEASPATIDNLSATSIPFKKIPADIETDHKKDEDYEYDNLQPNLEIIPFVAADAVVEQDGGGTSFPPLQDALRETDDPLFPYNLNLFSPPQETEGGFVPRDPPPLYGDYHVDRADVVDCATSRHGAPAPTAPGCERCLCLFGAVVCQPASCDQDAGPFRDVIRTEPAPGLHELIGDLHQHHRHLPTTSDRPHQQDNTDTFYDTVYQLLGLDHLNTLNTTSTTPTTTTTHKPTTPPWFSTTPSSKAPPGGSTSLEETSTALGLLKLAGCNIYGRMYRVGKIIAELSGPCLQCRCTDTGVQCTTLPC